MNLKIKIQKPLGVFCVMLFLLACNFTGLATATATTPAEATRVSASPVPSTSPTISATDTAPAPTQTPDPNAKTVKLDKISFVIPGSIASAATRKVIPAVTVNKRQPWLMAPQTIRIDLKGYSGPKGSYISPQIFLFPAQAYAAVNSGADTSLQRLKAILSSPSAVWINAMMPWLPFTPGEESIAAQSKLVAFKNGTGIRSLTQYDIFLDPQVTAPGDPIVNRLLFYHYEGLSTDGNTYIVAILPLQSTILADDPRPNASVPEGGIPYPKPGVDITHFNYFKAVTDGLNRESADSFHPSLNLLDALIASIELSP